MNEWVVLDPCSVDAATLSIQKNVVFCFKLLVILWVLKLHSRYTF